MAEKRTIGLKSIKVGDVGADGGMGTVLTPLGVTYKDSATLTKESDAVEEFFAEEVDDPIEVEVTKGKTTIEWAIVDFAPDTLAKVLGGEVTGAGTPEDPKVWNAPAQGVIIERSIEMITKRNVKVEITRGSLSTSIDWSLGKSAMGQVKIKAQVLTPTKEGESSMRIS